MGACSALRSSSSYIGLRRVSALGIEEGIENRRGLQQAVGRFLRVPVVMVLYLACLLSCLAFPISVIVLAGSSLGDRSNVALSAVGRISAWRWALAVAASVALALLQFLILEIAYPVRE